MIAGGLIAIALTASAAPQPAETSATRRPALTNSPPPSDQATSKQVDADTTPTKLNYRNADGMHADVLSTKPVRIEISTATSLVQSRAHTPGFNDNNRQIPLATGQAREH